MSKRIQTHTHTLRLVYAEGKRKCRVVVGSITSGATSHPLPAFINQVLEEHSHTHLFTCWGWGAAFLLQWQS